MKTWNILSLLVITVLAAGIVAGCGSGDSPATPTVNADLAASTQSAQVKKHSMLGMWQFHVDSINGTVECVPMRTSQIHMNGLAFMEPPAGVAMYIDDVVDLQPDSMTLDIAIYHPFPGANFAAAFDICGIVITHGSDLFPFTTDIFFAGDGDIRVTNADGFTRWWNPVEFPPNATKPHLGYVDGLLGKPHDQVDFTAILNPYKYFATDLDEATNTLDDVNLDNRGVMEPGTTSIRRYEMSFTPGAFTFNYAVDASWLPATPSGPDIVVPDDFPVSANRDEAWRIEVTNIDNTLVYNSGTGMGEGAYCCSVYVYDWFQPENTKVCMDPMTEAIMGTCNPFISEEGDGYVAFDFFLPVMMMDSADDILVWVKAQSGVFDYQGMLEFEEVCTYYQLIVEVDEQ